MKFTNILLTALFGSATIISVIAGHATTNRTINVFTGICVLLTICAGQLLYEDAKIANRRRRRRAEALRMTGYERLRSGAWIKNPHVTMFETPIETGCGPAIVGYCDIDAIERERKLKK